MSSGSIRPCRLYHQDLAPQSQRPDRRRDRLETRLLREALRTGLPVLGICRGLQFLNVYHGGTLDQHHPKQAIHRVRTPDRALPAHEVILQPYTRLATILGAPYRMPQCRASGPLAAAILIASLRRGRIQPVTQ